MSGEASRSRKRSSTFTLIELLAPPGVASRAKRSSTFTLIELLVAITILTFGLVGVLGAFGKSAETLRIAHQHMVGASLAKQEMGRLEAQALTPAGLLAGVAKGEFGTVAPGFIWERDIEEDQPGLLRVTLKITHERSERSVTLATLIPVRE
ncbi:MAG: prepilin-type N-terminal cleavage/methylation domain-containing protein [Lentisphaeria bacterium]|nr:prepilin-type N-terminal cleavage/methylation domain-containing protein [Lentisphaeria bacterium]